MLLAIDPGREKCGWALLTDGGHVTARGIWKRDEVHQRLRQLADEYSLDAIVLGDGTGHRSLLSELQAVPAWRERLHLVAEARSSEEARALYVRENTSGWRRLIPASLRYPDKPYDDYVAVILGRRHLSSRQPPGGKDGRATN